MTEFLGFIDILVGLLILFANLFNRAMINFPATHKVGLWLVAVSLIYHGFRNIAPNEFLYGTLMIELSHIGLWIVVCSVFFTNWKRQRTMHK